MDRKELVELLADGLFGKSNPQHGSRIMKELDINELQALHSALGEITGYLTDNSCSDPDCCGGPLYRLSEFEARVDVLEQYGLTVNLATALDPIYEQERAGS